MGIVIWIIVTIAIVALLLGGIWGLNRIAKLPRSGDDSQD